MPGNEAQLRRAAVQTVAQLPENYDDAVAVLGYALELVEMFIKEREPPAIGNVVPMRS